VGITFIYVTHDQEEAMTMSDRIAVMNAGRFEQIGAPQEVYEAPQTDFVASFLGASNLLEGEVEGSDGDRAKVRLSVGTTITLPAERLPEGEGSVRIGVRPEKLHIRTRESADLDEGNAIEATVDISTYTGVSTAYECLTADGTKIVVYVQNLGRPEAPMRSGTPVRLSWLPEHTFAVAKGKGPARKGGDGA
jgi:spermidine/putrescine transport system ATP-binding protein